MMGLGVILASLRSIPDKIFHWVRRQAVVSVDITSDNDAFHWIDAWLNEHPYSRRARKLTASYHKDTGEEGRQLLITPSTGNHLFFYNRRPIWLSRERKDITTVGDVSKLNKDTFVFTTVGRKQNLIRTLIEEAKLKSDKRAESEKRIHVYINSDSYWVKVKHAVPRPLATVYLPSETSETLIKDVQAFHSKKEWYKELGIPYRRGYLLYGIPGSGKSSLTMSVAGHFGMEIYSLSLSDSRLTDSGLKNLIAHVDPYSVILLEDIDTLFAGRVKDDSIDGGVTFQGLLNALDGVETKESILLFMSTNHREKLDSALIRPGRVDVQLEFSEARAPEIERMVKAFMPDIAPRAAVDLASELELQGLSMAEVQNKLMLMVDFNVLPVSNSAACA